MPTDPVVRVVGNSELTVPVSLPDDHGFATGSLDEEFRCESGDPIPGTWNGLDVGALLEAADTPPETTHLLVEGDDGFTACVPIGAAADGVLAFERNGPSNDAPRFAAPGISGTRTVKAVRRLEATVVDAAENPEAFEDLRLDEREP